MGEANVTGQDSLDAAPLVSAIIPTVGRPALVRAVGSALSQSWSNIEVIVSIDGARQLLDGLDLPRDPRLRIIASDSHVGEQITRGRGIAESSGAFIALLDDDDEWLPTKIENQLTIAMRRRDGGDEHVLIACRSDDVRPNGQVVRTVPRRLPSPGESISKYLFERRQITPGETAIGNSMLLFDRELVDIVPFDTSLPNHTDWNWLLSVYLRESSSLQRVC
jgi:glycosyltransferase involved in cell wall biosynthesis